MSSFANAVKTEANFTRTENGAKALESTGSACLDLFGSIGSLREADDTRIERLFANAYAEDPLTAAKIVFYGRDIREGLGERASFRTLLTYMAKHMPEAVLPNLSLIAEYGRFDDWYALMDTPCEPAMWNAMKKQLDADLAAANGGKAPSLLAKWLKTADASSKNTRKMGIATALHLGRTVYDYKRQVRFLRKKLQIVERKMSAKAWGEIRYDAVPSRAMMLHTNAFTRHDPARFLEYLDNVNNGTAKIHAKDLFPYDIAEKYLYNSVSEETERTLEAQWKALPDYVQQGTNILVMADTSGSMYGRPLASALGLAVYFAERNTGAYQNLFMTFSSDPQFLEIKGETLQQKFAYLKEKGAGIWGFSTNLSCAMQKILEVAIENHVPAEEMPEALVIISDMEIDECTEPDKLFYDETKEAFEKAGYSLPNLVFWNVNSRHDIFHVDAEAEHTQCVSGQSAAVFHQVISAMQLTPYEAMLQVVNSERYAAIQIAEKAA